MSVFAYRAWVVQLDGMLTPARLPVRGLPPGAEDPAAWARAWVRAWETGTATATCPRMHCVAPPNPDCTCGIYAWKRPVDPGAVGRAARAQPSHVAVGVVRLWGQMCDGTNMTGYRAEHAQVVALVADKAGNFDRGRYPGVRVYPDLISMYSEWDITPELGFAADALAASHRRGLVEAVAPGRCLACSEPVTPRQRSVDYAGRNPWAGGREAPVRFHRRKACIPPPSQGGESLADTFDRAWSYANRQPSKLHCPGVRTDHTDDTFTCTEGDQCPSAGWRNGELVRHAEVRECFYDHWPCHVCELRCPGLLRLGDEGVPG